MVSKRVLKEIDRAIKKCWISNVVKDYNNDYLLREDSLKCAFYYHLRRKLARILEENNLRIYPEFYFSDLKYKADIAIVEINPDLDEKPLKDTVTDVVAVIELKYAGGNSERTASWIKSDVFKIKDYYKSGHLCQYYFAVIYETVCSSLAWMDKRSTNHWASGYVTELNAGYINEKMRFEINTYNNMNMDLSK